MRRLPAALPLLACALLAPPAAAADEPRPFPVTARKYVEVQELVPVTDPATNTTTFVAAKKLVPGTVTYAIDPAKSAVVVCDMWDDHWCKSAAARCAELAKQTEPVLKACRDAGMTIVHCPSDTMAFYKDH